MSDGNKRKNIADEVREATEGLASAQALRGLGHHKGAVNRAYYAAFHAARALLLTRGLEAKTHRGVRDVFLREFARQGVVPEELSSKLDRLEGARTGADYDAGTSFTAEQVDALIEEAKAVVEGVTEALRQGGWTG